MRILKNEPLSKHTSLHIGGIAEYFCIVNTVDELQTIIDTANQDNKQIKILGLGTNLLVDDAGIDGYVLKLDGDFTNIFFDKNIAYAGAATSLQNLVQKSIDNGFAGMEVFAGIPSTIGGAVFGNAGAYSKAISDFIDEIKVFSLQDNCIKILRKNDVKFDYRFSDFGEDVIILEVKFVFENIAAKDELMKKYIQILDERKKSQPYNRHSAGCVFKNPKGFSSGKLIDDAQLKGIRVGGVSVSDMHANFFVADDGSSSRDFLKLVEFVRQKIKDEYNINLELEIKYWRKNV